MKIVSIEDSWCRRRMEWLGMLIRLDAGIFGEESNRQTQTFIYETMN